MSLATHSSGQRPGLPLPWAVSSALLEPPTQTRRPSARPLDLPHHPPHRDFYLPGLDGVRACAFLMVYLAHATRGSRIASFLPATLGITIFFFLSGYLITTLLRRELATTGRVSLRDFYIRRALRILVPLYVVYALAALLAHFAFHASAGNTLGTVSTLLQCYNYTGQLLGHAQVPDGMGVLWSLAIEEHFYLLFPLAWLGLQRLPRRTMLTTLVGFCLLELLWRLALALWIAPGSGGSDWASFATDARLDSILWGCVLALAHNPACGDRGLLPRGRERLTFAAAALLFVLLALPPNPLYKDTLRYTLQALDLYVLFSYLLAHPGAAPVRWLQLPALRYLGRISYVLYLSHFFILESLLHQLPARLASNVLFITMLGLLLSLAFASAVRWLLERPLQRVRRRFRTPPAPTTVTPASCALPSCSYALPPAQATASL